MLLLDEPFGMLDSLTRFELQEVLLDLWRADRKTALMVTHDVDEALFLSDRVALMTNGPDARLGAVLKVPFPRPRERHEVMAHPAYYELREEIMTFLEDARPPAGTGGLAEAHKGHTPSSIDAPDTSSDAYGRGLPTKLMDTLTRRIAAPFAVALAVAAAAQAQTPPAPPQPAAPAASRGDSRARPPSRSRSRLTASPTSTSSPIPTR